jgi:hypothetical protein
MRTFGRAPKAGPSEERMNSINRVEVDGVEYAGGAIVASYVVGAMMLFLQYVRAF